MGSKSIGSSQWLSINEDALFLQDGLIKVTDLVSCNIETSLADENENEVLIYETDNVSDLAQRIVSVCDKQNSAYMQLLQYRLIALCSLWAAQRQFNSIESSKRDRALPEEALLAFPHTQGLWLAREPAPFTSRISLLLIYPILQSQSKTDPNLCDATIELLLQCLRDYPPLSLSKEPSDCLDGLENLLCTWLGGDASDQVVANARDTSQQEKTASALVALACARGSLKTFIRTVHLLQSFPNLCSLYVTDILHKLLELEGGNGYPSAILGMKHILCWDFEDFLNNTLKRDNLDVEHRRSISSDGKFLYTTNYAGYKLAKIGSGYHGTLRGCLYAKNVHLGPGLVAWGNNVLLFRLYEFDNQSKIVQLAILINLITLKSEGQILLPTRCIPLIPFKTIHFCSDGYLFYWVWTPRETDKNYQGHPVYLDVFHIAVKEGNDVEAIPVQERILLLRSDETSSKVSTGIFLSKLRLNRSAPFNALTGTTLNTLSQEPSANTSCGLPLKTLQRSPIYCCGRFLTILTSSTGSNNSTARFLFGNPSNTSHLKTLATNLSFNVSDGLFNSRIELLEAPFCSLSRGDPLHTIGTCFDSLNNTIWMCSNQWIDQFHNPGNQAIHHVGLHLGTDPVPRLELQGETLTLPDVIRYLMHHVGSSCFHQLTSELFRSQMGNSKRSPVDVSHLQHLVNVLEISLRAGDHKLNKCALVALQVVFKTTIFKLQNPTEITLVKRIRDLGWQLLESPVTSTSFQTSHFGEHLCYGTQGEVCQMLCSGLHIMYPTASERDQLLHQLLTDQSPSKPCIYLRNLILSSFAEELNRPNLLYNEAQIFCFSDELLNILLKMIVKESCDLLDKCVLLARQDLESLLAVTPVASPLLQYLYSYEKFLLREAFLSDQMKSDEDSKQAHYMPLDVPLNFSKNVFNEIQPVIEKILEVCNVIQLDDFSDGEYWLSSLEKIVKATIVGQIIPLLATSLTHSAFLSVEAAQLLISPLIQLTIPFTQASLFFKTLLRGRGINLKNNCQDMGDANFLLSLKIPTPWASARTVESPHPVRDNYKFKEVVQIHGARCLYLLFDSRCASQYDYDKLVVYAGPNTSSRKIGEYGGNSFGYGSRSMLGSGWPKDFVKVDGDTVTFSFEMRSAREHNTPDKALWGFAVTVRAQESTKDMAIRLPFLADLSLTLSVLLQNLIKILYEGPACTQEEKNARILLESHLMQKCRWIFECDASSRLDSINVEANAETIDFVSKYEMAKSNRTKLSKETLNQLRDFCQSSVPQLRPSIQECISAEILEEALVSTILKHFDLEKTLHQTLSNNSPIPEKNHSLLGIMKETYNKLSSLIRNLQVFAELETKWWNETKEICEGSLISQATFFSELGVTEEVRHKELKLLCFLKNIDTNGLSDDECIRELQERIEDDASKFDPAKDHLPKTRELSEILIDTTELVYFLTCDFELSERTMETSTPSSSTLKQEMTKHTYGRSISAPCFRIVGKNATSVKRLSYPSQSIMSNSDTADQENELHHTLLSTLHMLFAFIGSSLKEPVPVSQLLSSFQVRCLRAQLRKSAMNHIEELLRSSSQTKCISHLIALVASILQQGPKLHEFSFTRITDQLRMVFSSSLKCIVEASAMYPTACYKSIGSLTTIPYTRLEENCLVESGLVKLLDCLCTLKGDEDENSSGSDLSLGQKVSALAWAGFQVLSRRCIMWEQHDGEEISSSLSHSGLAGQIAHLVINYLSRATDKDGKTTNNDVVQEVLLLLNNLTRSHLGKMILSQSICVSKLLSLLLDPRPSPKLILITLQLCRVALPLLSYERCAEIKLPSWDSERLTLSEEPSSKFYIPVRIVNLLLIKLGDFITPGHQTVSSKCSTKEDANTHRNTIKEDSIFSQDPEITDEIDAHTSRLSVMIHKREDQTSHDIIQRLISDSEYRSFTTSAEKVIRMDRDLTKCNEVEMYTEEAPVALQKAMGFAQRGFLVSLQFPMKRQTEVSSEKKKLSSEMLCREKNIVLTKTDPVRPFISGQVANSMASEVIALLDGLIKATENCMWAESVNKVLIKALSLLPEVLHMMEDLKSTPTSPPSARSASSKSLTSPSCNLEKLITLACQVNAALCTIGGFKESLKPGLRVKITGKGIVDSEGSIVSISEQQGIANVELSIPTDTNYPRASNVVQVPLSRLIPCDQVTLPLEQDALIDQVFASITYILRIESPSYPFQTFSMLNETNSLVNAIHRTIAEIQTRMCLVLTKNLQNPQFLSHFLDRCLCTSDILKSFSKMCDPGLRLPLIELQCERLRMLYRDCSKPPLPPNKTSNQLKKIAWDISCIYPPVRGSIFSHDMTTVTFIGESTVSLGLPRGILIYANSPISPQASLFYWEIEICPFGDDEDEPGPAISFGFSPKAEKREGAWTNPVGAVLFHNNGRAVHYNGSSLLQWKSVRLDVSLNPGDVAGIGWERSSEASETCRQSKGFVFFTHNARRQNLVLDDVNGGMWPVLHIQKKNTLIKTNFGSKPFAYKEEAFHCKLANSTLNSVEEISANFGLLPFPNGSDTDTDSSECFSPRLEGQSLEKIQGIPCQIITTAKSQREYNNDLIMQYKLPQSFTTFTELGPSSHVLLNTRDEDSEKESEDEKLQDQDHHALLVKAWESKVFPIIRRRFRNEGERKDGLDQIRGALHLGMTDIARQTVEFLYEENGGIPQDLHLPSLEDIKEDCSRFTIDHIRKGMTVVIRNPCNNTSGSPLLPKFAVHSMLKTFGLTGIVLDVETQQELVQVESYLKSEGILVRFWYPISIVERPSVGFRKTAITGAKMIDVNCPSIQRQLLQTEHTLAKLYCREAFLQLVDFCGISDFAKWNTNCSSKSLEKLIELKQLDIGNLQLLSNKLLASPSSNGIVGDCSLLHNKYPEQYLSHQRCLPSNLFYDNYDRLKTELASSISQTSDQGEEYLIELASQLCMCLQVAPENFPCKEIVVGETKLSTDLYFPNAAFLIVSCRSDSKKNSKTSSLKKPPWARIACYSGHQVSNNGQPSKQTVICYPRDATISTQSSYPVGDQYPSVVLPCNRINVSVGGTANCNSTLLIHAVPPELPLALAFIEQLLIEGETVKEKYAKESPTSYTISHKPNMAAMITVLIQTIEYLSNYLWRTDVPTILKERLFHLLAELLRTIHYSQDPSKDSSVFPMLGAQLSPTLSLLLHLQSELRKLYEEEIKNKNSTGTGENNVRFSYYFQSLMEVSLAVAEVTSPITPVLYGNGFGLAASVHGGNSPPPSTTPSSPSTSNKRKKLKAKRDRDRMSSKSRSGSSSPRSSICESDSAENPIIRNISISSIDKPEDTLWFHCALIMSQVLNYMVNKYFQGITAMKDCLSDANQSLWTPTAPKRLLIISGILPSKSEDFVKRNLFNLLKNCGGCYEDEIFVPSVTLAEEKKQETDTSANDIIAIKGSAVVELRCAVMVEKAQKILLKTKCFIEDTKTNSIGNEDISENLFSVSTVDQNLQATLARDNDILDAYLKTKIFSNLNDLTLRDAAVKAMMDIFLSCIIAGEDPLQQTEQEPSIMLSISREQISNSNESNLLFMFLTHSKSPEQSFSDHVSSVLKEYGIFEAKESSKSKEDFEDDQMESLILEANEKQSCLKEKNLLTAFEEKCSLLLSDSYPEEKRLAFDGLVQYFCLMSQTNVKAIWQGLLACGYDFHFNRCCCTSDKIEQTLNWTIEMDSALANYVNSLCNHLNISPSHLHPHEIYFSMSERNNPLYRNLQDVSIESTRLRFALLQFLNNNLESFFLSLVDLRPVDTFSHSMATLLSRARHLIFYDSKMAFVNHILNLTVLRKSEQAVPEIILDPLETIGTELKDVISTQFCQAMRQLSEIPSSQFCVPLASGGDPMFAFNVKHLGEEVHGTSGSFRQFLLNFSKELYGPLLNQLILCPSDAANVNKNKLILKPGSMTYAEEQLLYFFGQMLGISIRANIPLPLDILSTTWRALVNMPLDDTSLKEADILTYNYLAKFDAIHCSNDMDHLSEEFYPLTFRYTSLLGDDVNLDPDSKDVFVSWNNYRQYTEAIHKLRMNELEARDRVTPIHLGLASVVPFEIISLLTPGDMELRICGVPLIDINFLKAHTMYQVGLTESDPHIEYFWSTLESFTQEELRKFIKFACNQDRVPSSCPCRNGQIESPHLPPFPMKLAPPDGKPGAPDKRYIRVETCMFMVKLPQYTTQEIMKEKLLQAINCLDDPLSG